MIIKCNFSGVSERDMDDLFMGSLAADKDFAEITIYEGNINFADKLETVNVASGIISGKTNQNN